MADQALLTAAGTDPHDGYLTAEDPRAIEDLVATYALSLDVNDVEQTLGLFTGDGEFAVFGPVFTGPSLRRMFETAQHGLHLTGRSMITPHPGRAAVRTQPVFFPADHSPHRLAIYDKIAVKIDGRWLYRRVECRFLNSEGVLGLRP